MRLIVCFSVMVTVAMAAPQYNNYNNNAYRGQQQQQQPKPSYNTKPFVPILAYSNELSHDGSYAYSYQTGDGSSAQESGYVKNAGRKDQEAQTVQGSYSYTAPDGTPITVTYIADENGFRADGAHLPTPPPIPEAIAKSLQLIASTQRGAGANLAVYQQQQPPLQQQYGNYNNKRRY